MVKRPSKRAENELREIQIIPGYMDQADGSCLIKVGGTHVICTATVEEKAPIFLRNTGKGWVTAEYGMLPCSTNSRIDREASRGKQSGRTQEIQRLIGRSLRSVTDLGAFGEKQIRVDCDVLRADGGTRTAAITGGYVALYHAFQKLMAREKLKTLPLKDQVAAVSAGIYQGMAILDLDYLEDSSAQADVNFVLTGRGGMVEVQGTAETDPFSEEQFNELLQLAKVGIAQLSRAQLQATSLFKALD